MNRLTSVSDSLGISFSSQQSLQTAPPRRDVRRPALRDVDEGIALFAPMHYERNYAYPLLVWLHDDHGNERQLRQVMPHLSMRNFVAAGVRASAPSRQQRHGYVWRQSAEAVRQAAELVREAIDEASERYHVHADRVFVVGHRNGGTMALRLALRFPEWFAGAVSLCGPMPQGDSPLARVNDARHTPLLMASANESRFYDQAQVVADLRLLHSAGFSLALRHYPGDCDLTTEMLADVNRWVMQRICPSAQPTE
ncbi:MAG: hypothetical protein CMJ58_24205 [Planctomycetaceae bacterium]|nr:hypothetical protein [Planctomycetaceae bacterium]